METFDFPYHVFSTDYPESSLRVQFGKSWEFTAEPDAPDQRIFKLDFEGMEYFTDAGGAVSASIAPQRNMLALEQFYQRHRQWKSFIYPHPVYGNVVVKFQMPLRTPKGVKKGNGVVEKFEISLIEQP